MFFTRFNFFLSYCPGSRNITPAALSRQFLVDDETAPNPSTILPAPCLVATLTWEIEERVTASEEGQPGPTFCLKNRLFVPRILRSDVLQWAHSSCLTGHPGSQRIKEVLQQWFWWPTLETDTKDFVSTFPGCCQHKASRRVLPGYLQPVPQTPWSHICLDFVTGLPLSGGFTTILDGFSKMAHFVPLPKLPSPMETAELVLWHVFQLHGLSFAVVSDRGPLFTSVFQGEFCCLIGASSSLSSGFHPQSNGQSERLIQVMETALHGFQASLHLV